MNMYVCILCMHVLQEMRGSAYLLQRAYVMNMLTVLSIINLSSARVTLATSVNAMKDLPAMELTAQVS